jgi:acyl carrier protein
MSQTFEDFKNNIAFAVEDDSLMLLDADIPFKSLQSWDSLAALSVMAMINQEYDITISADELENAITLNDLYLTILNKRNER